MSVISGTIIVQDTKGSQVFVDILLALYVVNSPLNYNSELTPIFSIARK